jgi:hypothetical protein
LRLPAVVVIKEDRVEPEPLGLAEIAVPGGAEEFMN